MPEDVTQTSNLVGMLANGDGDAGLWVSGDRPAPGVEDIVDKSQRILLVCNMDRIWEDLCVGIRLCQFFAKAAFLRVGTCLSRSALDCLNWTWG